MSYDRLKYILVWLLITATAIFLADRLFSAIGVLATPLLLFALAWLFALALQPLVDILTRLEVPVPVPLYSRGTRRMHIVVPTVHLPRAAAVSLVYLGMLAVIAGIFVLLVPVIVPQIANLQQTLPEAGSETVNYINNFQRYINQLGLKVELTAILRPESISAQVGAVGSELVKQSFTIAGGIASLLFNLVFVLILSFYITLDGPRLVQRGIELLPRSWHSELDTFVQIVDRTFGGFLRAQVLQSLLYGIATAALMVALGLSDVALASVIAGVMVLIPIIGGPIAMVPPIIIAIIVAPDRLIWVIVGLLLIQQVIFNMIMPRLLGQIIGLHPLLVFAALLVGSSLAGVWGIVFGIPLAGVVAAILQFFYDRANSPLAVLSPPASDR